MKKIQSLKHKYNLLEEALEGSKNFEEKFKKLNKHKPNLSYKKEILIGEKYTVEIDIYEEG